MTAKQCPTLPAELWLRVLENLQKEEDLPELWTSHRYVCTAFKQAVEAIMRENHLRKTWINFQLGTYILSCQRSQNLSEESQLRSPANSHGNTDLALTTTLGEHNDDDEDTDVSLNSEFEFLHLSEDKTLATFQIDETDEKYKAIIRKRLREAVEDRIIEAPQYDIQIHRDINDGPIPGLSVDYENLQLTCDWREMFSIFYGEEQIYHQMLGKWVKDKEAWTIGLREKMERGELDMGKLIEQAIGGFASGSEDARKIARRARIRREFQRLDGSEWDAELDGDLELEKQALKHLKDSRYICSFETHSDDEDEDEDEDEDHDDEWEDEDEDEDDADDEQ